MDVSTWTPEQRVKLQDYLFGSRVITSVRLYNNVGGTWVFGIGDYVFPDPCCIWAVSAIFQPTDNGSGRMRFGLANAVPLNPAAMDLATEIFPHFGSPLAGPNEFFHSTSVYQNWVHYTRKALVSSGWRLVVGLRCTAGVMRAEVAVTVSPLPTAIPDWIDHYPI